MLAETSSPPPPDPVSAVPSAAQPQGRKRKRAAATASSPAPSDPGTPAPPELIFTRADLSKRPQLSISRGPVFIPTAEGSEFFKTDLIGVNRIGFRYTPAGITPPGSALPCRTIESNPTYYRVSWEDRSPFVQVTKDGLGIQGTKGFRSARCNAPIREGKWYMEVKIIHGGGERAEDDPQREGSHVRLGWGRREAPLNGPVGLDGYSYGYRDKTGDKVSLSRPRPYGQPFASGDVVGMYISLPTRRQANKKDPHDPAHIKRERIPIDLKGQETFEILEYPPSKEMIALVDYSGKSSNSVSLPSTSTKKSTGKLPERGPSTGARATGPPLRPIPSLPDSRIAFFVNGKCQGIAFQDIYDYLQLRVTDPSRKKEKKRTREGVKEHQENPFDDGSLGYYPFISVFNSARVQLNSGPDFEFSPPNDIDELLLSGTSTSSTRTWRPVSERYPEFMQEQWDLDKEEEEVAKADLARRVAAEKVEAEKKAQRAKKKQQADAKKRAKIASETPPPAPLNDDRLTIPSTAHNPSMGQPSPLRNATAYDFDAAAEPMGQPSPLRNSAAYDFPEVADSVPPMDSSGYDLEEGAGSDEDRAVDDMISESLSLHPNSSTASVDMYAD
ncbi:COMPASS complex protein [Mycena floridula]|nr:COMPASS complex protein [Mycena floridula]